MKAAAIIPAAGSGQRMGGVRKAFMQIAGKPLLQHSIDAFRSHPAIQTVIVALAASDLGDPPEWLNRHDVLLVQGGAERADSVRAGMAALPVEIDVVVVHDAARPLINADLIDRVLAEVQPARSATLAIQVTDTLHAVDDALCIAATPDRQRFWRAQTPQAFPRAILEAAFSRQHVARATDEAGLVAAAGGIVKIVPGEAWNIKVTTYADVAFAEAAFAELAR